MMITLSNNVYGEIFYLLLECARAREIRKQLKNFISKTTNEALDLVVNLTGIYINEKEREKLKREAEFEIGTNIEELIAQAYQIGLKFARAWSMLFC